MDFIYDFQEDTALPEPAPPLALPLNTLGKFKGLSLANSAPAEPSRTTISTSTPSTASISTTEKYLKATESLFQELGESTVHIPVKQRNSFGSFVNGGSTTADSMLSAKLATVLNSYGLNEGKLRDTLAILQQRTAEMDFRALTRSDLLGAMQRRRFRSDIESELLKQHSSVLREFQPVVTKMDHIGEKIADLNKLKQKLNSFGDLDAQLLSQIESLNKGKQLIMLKRSLLASFKKSFTLTQYEEHFLTNEQISLEYFQALQKCHKIHSNCSILLTLTNPTLGMKIMEKMSKILDLSYQRIAFFLSNKLGSVMDGSTTANKDMRLLKIALFFLANNLKYFDQVISKLISSRSKTIVDDFLYQSNNNEIAMSAHDPLRYIGDLLAFVHALIVNEVEFITTLFKLNADDEIEYERSEFENSLIQLENLKDVNRSINETIEKIIGSLSRPLKIRMEQIIRSEKQLDVICKIYNLLDLYKMMYHKQLPSGSLCPIFETLETSKQLCVERVLSVLKEKFVINEKSLEGTDWKLDDESLLAPDWTRYFYNDTLTVFDDLTAPEERLMSMDQETYKSFMNLLVEKPIELVTKQAKNNFKSDKVSWKIFLLNSLDLIESKFVLIPSLSTEVKQLSALISTTKDDLIQHQYETLLKDSGLDIHRQLIQLIFPIEQIETEDDYYMYSSLIENKLFSKDKLQELELQIHEFLPVALIDIQQALFKISSPSIANDIITESSLKYLKLYDVLYKILHILYEDDELLEWSTREVATLLGVEQLIDEAEAYRE